MTSPIDSSGTITSTFMMGSNSTGEAPNTAFLKPIEPAILKAISEESTGRQDPIVQVTLISVTAYPARAPSSMASMTPFSTAGMYCRGMTPPTI